MKKKTNVMLLLLCVALFCFALASCDNRRAEQLKTPQNLRVEGSTLVWDEVENAVSYIVYFSQKEHETLSNSFDLSALAAPAVYKIEVMAVGDGLKYSDSEWAEFSYTAEETVNAGYNEDGYLFRLLEDGTGYMVSNGQVDIFETEKIILPDYFKGLPVKRIRAGGFSNYNPDYDLDNPNYIPPPEPYTESYCNRVTRYVKLPAYLEVIEEWAFAGTLLLEEIDLPDSMVEMGEKAFYGCKKLKEIKFSSSLKRIGAYCFQGCAVSDLNLPDGLEEISSFAFSGILKQQRTGNKKYTEQNMTEVKIPQSVKKVGAGVFEGCRSLTDVDFPDVLESLGADVLEDTAWFDAQPDGVLVADGCLFGYKGEIPEKLFIPDGVKHIATSAFFKEETLNEVYIPDGVKFIGSLIFSSCRSLTYVRLPADLTEISTNAFSSCVGLTRIELPSSLKVIGDSAFKSCSSLADLNLPDGLEEIGSNAFSGCVALKKVVFPKSLKTLGEGSFWGCSDLEEVVIPSSLEVLGSDPFKSCPLLESIFFEGDETRWRQLTEQEEYNTDPDRKSFSDASIYFYSEQKPVSEGNFWRYSDGVAVVR